MQEYKQKNKFLVSETPIPRANSYMKDSKVRGKKRVLFVITKSVWGGAGKYVYDLAKNLPKEKFEVYVAAGGQNKLAQKLKKENINYSEIKNFRRDINILNDILAFFEILNLIHKINPDIVHVNSSKAGGIAGAAVKICKIFRLCGGESIFTAHGWAFNEMRPKWQIYLTKLASKITSLFYNKIICVSEFDRQSAVKNKIAPAKKLTTIHNGLGLNEYSFLTKEKAQENLKSKVLNLKNKSQNSKLKNFVSVNDEPSRAQTPSFLIGAVGEFTKNKGQKYLIESLNKLEIKNFKFLAIIIGWGENKKKLESQIINCNLQNNVFLIENLSPAAPYLKAFDIFILPSLKEGLPYTLLEAGLAEIPTIATNVGGNKEIIEDKKTGLLVNPANPGEMARAIEILIKNPKLAKNLALNLHKKVLREFSLEKMVNETLEIYNL
jgi:glycosyltransferase involved in cell wall biosynthesis